MVFYYQTEQEKIVKTLQIQKDIPYICDIFVKTNILNNCKFLFFEDNSGSFMPMPSYLYDDLSVIGIYGFDYFKYIDKKQALAFSNNKEGNLHYTVCIDFDSNILGRMPRIFESRNIEADKNLLLFLRDIFEKENIKGKQIDFTCKPYILENCMYLDDPDRLEGVTKSLNAYFTYMSFETIENFDKFFSGANSYPAKEVKEQTRDTIKSMWEIKKVFSGKEYLISQPSIYALLLQVAIIQFSSPKGSSSKQKIKRLLDFWLNELGNFEERELAIAILFFKKDSRTTRFFKRFTIENKKILQDILGMSWDLCHVREMERYIFDNDDVDFENHLLATSDKGLSEILRVFPVTSFSWTSNRNLGVRFSKDFQKLFEENGLSSYWEKRSPKWRRRIFEKTDLDYLIRKKEQELLIVIKRELK